MSLLDNLEGYWKLDEASIANGTTPITDSSGNSRTGTATADSEKSDSGGKIGRCVTFNTGDYIDCGANPISGSGAFSLSAWIKTTQVTAYSGAIAIGGSGSALSAYIGTVATAQVGTSSSIGGGFYGTNYGTGITTLNTWVHVVLTFAGGAGGAAKMYVDNVKLVDTTYTPNLSSGNIRIGRIGTDTLYDFNGSIDEVGLWSKELSSTEVASLYNNGNGLTYPFSAGANSPGNLFRHVTVGDGMSRNEGAT